MSHLDLLTSMAHQRRDEFLRQADERRLAATVLAPGGQRDARFARVRWRRHFAGSLTSRSAVPAEAGAGRP